MRSAGWDLRAGLGWAFVGSRSRPKAAMLTPARTAIQATKKSDPASKRNESVVINSSVSGAPRGLDRKSVHGKRWRPYRSRVFFCDDPMATCICGQSFSVKSSKHEEDFFRPPGSSFSKCDPRLAPWAAFYRRSAAAESSGSRSRSLADFELTSTNWSSRFSCEHAESNDRPYCSGEAGGASCMCFCMRASWFASISFNFDCWSGVSNWYIWL
jgi:hypothetical protein